MIMSAMTHPSRPPSSVGGGSPRELIKTVGEVIDGGLFSIGVGAGAGAGGDGLGTSFAHSSNFPF